MDNRFAEIVRHAMVPYRLNLNPGDRALIVADTGTDPGRRAGVHDRRGDARGGGDGGDDDAAAVAPRRAGARWCSRPWTRRISSTWSRPAARSTAAAVTPSSSPASASWRRRRSPSRCCAKVRRVPTMSGWTRWGSGSTTSGWAVTRSGSPRPRGPTCGPRSPGGRAGSRPGAVRENPGVDLYACGFPDGEVGIAPIEETIEGVVVWDTSMHHVGLLSEPIRGVVEHGRVVELTGGAEADRLRAYLEANGDEGSWMICEASSASTTRPASPGSSVRTRSSPGSMHIAIGMNTDTGGTVASRTHVDGVLRRPALTVDGVTVSRTAASRSPPDERGPRPVRRLPSRRTAPSSACCASRSATVARRLAARAGSRPRRPRGRGTTEGAAGAGARLEADTAAWRRRTRCSSSASRSTRSCWRAPPSG